MNNSDSSAFRDFREAIRGELGQDVRVSLFWKGRVALYAILRSLGVGEGDEVIVPGFTCVVVPNAVIYANAKPVYADIDPETYTVTKDAIEPLVTSKTKAIVTQNTFGLSTDLDPIIEMASKRGIEVIDDCAHGFGGRYKNRPNGVTTRTSFFSTQWNKPISTGIGGFAVTSDEEVANSLSNLEKQSTKPTGLDVLILRAMYMARRTLVGKETYWSALKLYRWLSARGLVIGSSQSIEVDSPVMPKDYFKGISRFQAEIGAREIMEFDRTKKFRKTVAVEYDETMARMGKSISVQPDYADHLFLKYPVRVKNRAAMMKEAIGHRVRLGDWFLSPLHPVEKDLSPWYYRKGSCPVAEELSNQVINLPTDCDMSTTEIERVKTFLSNNRDLVL